MLKIKMNRWRRTAEEYEKDILYPLITSGAVRGASVYLVLTWGVGGGWKGGVGHKISEEIVCFLKSHEKKLFVS